MSELSKSDLELVKLRAAKMSTKTIAMLMGGRWTEAKVYNRLAQIDGQVEAAAAALPVLHRIDEDLPEDPFALPPHIAEAIESRSTPFPGEPKVVITSNPAAPSRMAPWMASAVNYADPFPAFRPNVVFIGAASCGKSTLPVNLPSAIAAHLVAAPFALSFEDLPDACEAADQSSSIVAAAPDPQPDDAPTQARAVLTLAAQADGDQAGEAPDRQEDLATAPNPLAVEARPVVPVHKVRGRKAPSPVAAPAPNLLAATPPPPARQNPRGGALRLKPLTEKVACYAARFLAANWPIDEIAHLFDVSPEALEKVLA